MTDSKSPNHYYARRLYRVLSTIFGLFLTGVGIYAVFFGVADSLLRILVGLLIILFGANMLWSAIQSKASWLSRVGPLP